MSTYDDSQDHDGIEFDPSRPEDFVDAWLHGLLPDTDAQIVEQWCRSTPDGQRALQAAEQRLALLASVGKTTPNAALVKTTISKLTPSVQRPQRGWSRFRKALVGATAAAIAIIASAQSYYAFMKPTPYDVRMVGQLEWMAGSPASMQVVVRDLTQDALLDDVPCRLQLFDPSTNEQITLASFQSGESVPRFEVPDWKPGRYELRLEANVDDRLEAVSHVIELTRPWRLLMTTDKPLYQPGQTIHLRCQALRRPQLKPLASKPVVFRIKDPQGNVIFKREAHTSQFGIASADCELAREIKLGKYQVECEVGSTTSQRTVTVDRYTLPKLKIELAVDQPYYLAGDTVTLDVSGKYIFGKPIQNGDVEVMLVPEGINVDLDRSLSGRLDDEGRATFTFELPTVLIGRPEDQGMARIRAIAVVRDQVGQELVRDISFPVAPAPLLVELIPESPTSIMGVPNQVYVLTSYPDGRPASARVTINGGQIDLQTNSLGTGRFELTPNATDVRLTAVAQDEEGRVGRVATSWSATRQQDAYLVRTDRSIYKSGETVVVSIVSSGVEPVFVDLIKDQQTMLSQVVPVESGRGTLEIDLPTEVFGTLRLETYRMADTGLAARRTQVIVVRPNDQINIATSYDRSEYQPGETAEVEIRLTDEQGKPRPGAIGLSVVDEALYSLLNYRAGMEQTFFLLEQELLRPVYAIYDRWGLDDGSEIEVDGEQRLQERRLWHQALFARTVSQVGVDLGSNSAVKTRTVSYSNPYSLDDGNFQEKSDQVAATREAGLSYCRIAWVALILAVCVAISAAFAVAYPRAFAITAGLVAIGGSVLGSIAMFMFLMVGAAKETADMSRSSFETIENAMDGARAMRGAAGSEAPPRVRRDFPETLYWQPELITDDEGIATLSLPLADSITTWRFMLSAVDAEGRLGGAESSLVVFQPFQVDVDAPVTLTRGDEYELPIVVYNFSNQPQEVRLEIQESTGLQEVGSEFATESRVVESGEVAAWPYRVRATQVGKASLRIVAHGSTEADAIERVIEVVPNGQPVERALSRRVSREEKFEIDWPVDRVPDSQVAMIRLFPSTFSEIVNGIDAIFRRPVGCFEQTSSSNYPNVLALKYLRDQELNAPNVEAKARQFLHLGYQRLLSFEVAGGGFDWYGRAPANVSLTAYGLLQFKDMAEVHNVDPKLIARTEAWLQQQRLADGSWQPSSRRAGWISSTDSADGDAVLLTSHVAWAIYEGRTRDSEAELTEDFLLAHPAVTIDDPYLVAMVIQALAALESELEEIQPYVDQLIEMKSVDDEGLVYWKRPNERPNLMYGRGQSGQVEVTALAILSLIRVGQRADLVGDALSWIAKQKDAHGTWGSTQATILSLKALIEGTSMATTMSETRRVEILVDGMMVRELEIPPEQAEVVQMVNLTDPLTDGDRHVLQVRQSSDQAIGCVLTLRHHIDDLEKNREETALAIDVDYNKNRLQLDEMLTVDVTVENRMESAAPMVMLDLPIPAGFDVERSDWDAAVEAGVIGKYEVTARQIVVYLRQLAPGTPVKLRYRLRALAPVKLSVPPGHVYEYYAPERRASGGGTAIEVESPNSAGV